MFLYSYSISATQKLQVGWINFSLWDLILGNFGSSYRNQFVSFSHLGRKGNNQKYNLTFVFWHWLVLCLVIIETCYHFFSSLIIMNEMHNIVDYFILFQLTMLISKCKCQRCNMNFLLISFTIHHTNLYKNITTYESYPSHP